MSETSSEIFITRKVPLARGLRFPRRSGIFSHRRRLPRNDPRQMLLPFEHLPLSLMISHRCPFAHNFNPVGPLDRPIPQFFTLFIAHLVRFHKIYPLSIAWLNVLEMQEMKAFPNRKKLKISSFKSLKVFEAIFPPFSLAEIFPAPPNSSPPPPQAPPLAA